MFTLDLGEVSSITNIVNGGGGAGSLYTKEALDEYESAIYSNLYLLNSYYDAENSKNITVTTCNTLSDSFIFYKNTIIGLAQPEFLSEEIRLWINITRYKSECPEDGNPHFIPYENYWTKIPVSLDSGEDPTTWTFGKARLAYKSNNVHQEYCNPPFTWVYMIPVMKQHTQSPYVLHMLIIKVTAEYNEDETYTFSTYCQFEKIMETTQILGTTPTIEFAALRRFDDIDDYIYGVCGVDSKILDSAFWCLDGYSFKFNIKTQEFTVGSNIYSHSGWGSVYSNAFNDSTNYFYIPDIGEFRPDISSTSCACTLVVDTLELYDNDDSGWGGREKDLHKLSKYRYSMSDVYYTGENYYQYITHVGTSLVNWEHTQGLLTSFGKVPNRWDRSSNSSTYYPYADSQYYTDGFPEVDDLTTLLFISQENLPDGMHPIYVTDVHGAKYIAVLDNTTYEVKSEWIPYSGLLMNQIQHSTNVNASIFGAFPISKICNNVTNCMNEFIVIKAQRSQNMTVNHKLKCRFEVFYPRNESSSSGYNPFLLRDPVEIK